MSIVSDFLLIEGSACVLMVRSERQLMWCRELPRVALRPLLFILYTSELFHIVGNHIVGYADSTTIYGVFPRPLSRPKGMESLNQDLAAINSRYLK